MYWLHWQRLAYEMGCEIESTSPLFRLQTKIN